MWGHLSQRLLAASFTDIWPRNPAWQRPSNSLRSVTHMLMKTASCTDTRATLDITRSHSCFVVWCLRMCKHYSPCFLWFSTLGPGIAAPPHLETQQPASSQHRAMMFFYFLPIGRGRILAFFKLCRHRKVTSATTTIQTCARLIWIRLLLRAYVTSYAIRKCQIIPRITIILIRNTYLAAAHKQAQHISWSSASVIMCGPIHKWDCWFLGDDVTRRWQTFCYCVTHILSATYSFFPFTSAHPLCERSHSWGTRLFSFFFFGPRIKS